MAVEYIINSKSAVIAAYEYGCKENPTIVFLHGNGEDHTIFDKQLESFSRSYHVIAIDSRGHGNSTMGKQHITLHLMAEDVVRVMNFFELEKAIILGFSDGGNIAIDMALNHKERILKLVLIGANLYPKGMKDMVLFGATMMYAWYSILGRVWAKYLQKARITGLMIFEPHFGREQLKTINLPVLVLAGEKDLIKESHTRYIAKCIRGASLVIIKGAEHFVFYKGNREACNLIKSFIMKG